MTLASANVELVKPVLETHRDLIVMLPTINVNALPVYIVAILMRYVITTSFTDIVACAEVVEVVSDNHLGRTVILSKAHVNALQVSLLVAI